MELTIVRIANKLLQFSSKAGSWEQREDRIDKARQHEIHESEETMAQNRS
jgi:hypothetical protein